MRAMCCTCITDNLRRLVMEDVTGENIISVALLSFMLVHLNTKLKFNGYILVTGVAKMLKNKDYKY